MLTRLRLAAALLLSFGTAALAAPKKKPPAAPPSPAAKAPILAPKAVDKAVSELMGHWKWGMTSEEVLGALHQQMAERAAPELAKMTDVYEQTKIRKRLTAD